MKPFINKKETGYKLTIYLLLYLNTILTFSIIYLLLEIFQMGSLVDQHLTSKEMTWFHKITDALYFSAMTIFSVGYGDVTPFGFARLVAVIEAAIGYVLPFGIVIQFIMPTHSNETTERV